MVTRGQAVFAQAGCPQCHAGPDLTNHRVIPVSEPGTDPSRAAALKTTEAQYVAPVSIPSIPRPHPPQGTAYGGANRAARPATNPVSLCLWGHIWGYKVPSLIGVYWSAPYLHDGGVAVGPMRRRSAAYPARCCRASPRIP